MYTYVYTLGAIAVSFLVLALLLSMYYALILRGGQTPAVRSWPLLALVVFLNNLHYQSLFRYGIDSFIMAIVALISWQYSATVYKPEQSHNLDSLKHQPAAAIAQGPS